MFFRVGDTCEIVELSVFCAMKHETVALFALFMQSRNPEKADLSMSSVL